jgi:hypothetical protein
MGDLKLTLCHVSSGAGEATAIFHHQVENGNAFLRPHRLR